MVSLTVFPCLRGVDQPWVIANTGNPLDSLAATLHIDSGREDCPFLGQRPLRPDLSLVGTGVVQRGYRLFTQ